MSRLDFAYCGNSVYIFTNSITDLHQYIKNNLAKSQRTWCNNKKAWKVNHSIFMMLAGMNWNIPTFFTEEEMKAAEKDEIRFVTDKVLSIFYNEKMEELFIYKVEPDNLIFVRGAYLSRRFPGFNPERSYMFSRIESNKYILIN